MSHDLDALLLAEIGAAEPGGPGGPGAPSAGPRVDLRTILGELTAIKSAQRVEAKALRELHRTLDQAEPADDAEQLHRANRIAARALIDVGERLEASARSLRSPTPRWFWRRPDPRLQAVAEGLALSVRRIHDALSDLGVQRIVTLGAPYDPHRMEAVRLDHNPAGSPGVVEEITSGYEDALGVLRTAQVVVNQPTENIRQLSSSGDEAP